MIDGGSAEIRSLIAAHGVASLAVTDLTVDDLSLLAWSGSPTHVRHVSLELERAKRGEVDYLVVRAPDGSPISKGGVDYDFEPGAGTLWQLATRPDLRSLGIGTHLIAALENRIRRRGLTRALVGVEPDNEDARRLYERLGYTTFRQRNDSWEAEREDGSLFVYEKTIVDLEKTL